MSSSPRLTLAAYCREGLQVVFRNAVVMHARVAFRTAYPDTWRDELRKSYGPFWSQIEEASQRARATGARDTAPVDDFDLLGVEHFDVLISSHFDLLFPDPRGWTARARKAALTETQRWLKVITNARNVIAHATADDLSPHNVLEPLWAARHVLRSMHETSPAAELDQLIAHVFRAAIPGADSTTEILSFDDWMMAGKDVPPDEFFFGLIKFFQGLADFHEVEGREFREEFADGPWAIDRGPQKIALDIQDWWLGRPDETWELDTDPDA